MELLISMYFLFVSNVFIIETLQPVKVEVDEKKPAEVADPPKEPQVQPEEISKKHTVLPTKDDSPTSGNKLLIFTLLTTRRIKYD